MSVRKSWLRRGYLKLGELLICHSRLCIFLLFIIAYVVKGTLMHRSELRASNGSRIFGGYISSLRHAEHGMGNQLFHYVSLYAIGRTVGRKSFETSVSNGYNASFQDVFYTFPKLATHFEILKQEYYDSDCCKSRVVFANWLIKYDDPARLLNKRCKYLLTTGQFYESFRYFEPYQEDVKAMLTCNSTILATIDRLKSQLFQGDKRHKLCVHIRRGDFLENPVLQPSELHFTARSVPFVSSHLKTRKQADNITVVVVGDDPLWAADALENITLPLYIYQKSSSHATDLCFAINTCDSIILTASASTNGWWIGYMISPKPVFYRERSAKCHTLDSDERHLFPTDYYPPEWIPLRDDEICEDGDESCRCPPKKCLDLESTSGVQNTFPGPTNIE